MQDLSSLLNLYKDQLVELYLGDQFEEIQLADHSRQVNGVIFGVLKDVIGEFLVVDCYYRAANGEFKTGNIILINSWQVKGLTKIDGHGSLSDALLSVDHVNKIKKLIGIDDK